MGGGRIREENEKRKKMQKRDETALASQGARHYETCNQKVNVVMVMQKLIRRKWVKGSKGVLEIY